MNNCLVGLQSLDAWRNTLSTHFSDSLNRQPKSGNDSLFFILRIALKIIPRIVEEIVLNKWIMECVYTGCTDDSFE